jgi:hypothetical protein
MEFATGTNRNIFITGKAGTGKTTFLRKLRDTTTKQMAVVAPTGVAAINAGGTTIHSFFQLPFTPFTPSPEGRSSLMSRMKINNMRRRVLRELELLVIDEISMVRADLLDAIDTVLRRVRYRQSEPFGGVQMIFIGDMYQLSPIAKTDEWQLISEYYKSVFFFHSHVIQEFPPVYVEFNKVFRQTDNLFIQILNEVRNDSLSQDGFNLLQRRYNPKFNPSPNDNYITLTTHNHSADYLNRTELDKIESDTHEFNAIITGDFPANALPVEKTLELKEGAKVMFVKNDTEIPRRFYNGKIGVINSIYEDVITVKCPGDIDEIVVSKLSWENVRFNTNTETNTIEEEVIGTFEQIPLRLAWAITIHKSQGLTFEKAVIDAGKAFSPGQVYVALSRCKSIEGIVLKSPINIESISVDDQVVEFSSSKPDEIFINNELENALKEFKIATLLQLYDFTSIFGLAQSWLKFIKGEEPSFNSETLPFINSVFELIEQIYSVGERFKIQLKQIFYQKENNINLLSERLNSSSAYFIEKLDEIMSSLKKSPATTDSKSNAMEYDDAISEIFLSIALKKHLIRETAVDFNVELYYKSRNGFIIPSFSVKSYSKGKSSVQLKSNNPDLLNELVKLRNYLSENDNIPPYIVAATKTLVQMADDMPMTEKELLKIYGFGKKKLAKYGAQFLEVINNYISDNKIKSEMINFREN